MTKLSPMYVLKKLGVNEDRITEFNIYKGYWNDDTKPVIVGDWNHPQISCWSDYINLPEIDQMLAKERANRAVSLIEAMGYEIDWSDQIIMCDNCYMAVPTEDVTVYDGEASCPKCVKEFPEEHFTFMQDNPRRADNIFDHGELILHGWEQVNSEKYESVLHTGQTDDPRKIYKAEKESGKWDHLLFHICDAHMFTTTFCLWGKRKIDLDNTITSLNRLLCL